MIVRTSIELGHLVREHRLLAALTQAQLAAHVGVSRQWIIALERGKRTAELALVLRTLNVLGLDLDVHPRTGGRHR
ncbi:MAG: helix-turn-helix domain-containing protein [Gemmatimonadota bacterium]|nr:helix-turn-helix domain-containing protein [Gemmatimonadota bacterium]